MAQSPSDRAVVRNAADPRQVRFAKRLEQRRRTQEIDDLRAILRLEQGRRLLFRLLEHCSVFASIWDPSSRIHLNAGRQDVGHFLMAEIEAADEEALFTMMREARARRRAQELEAEAVQTPSADEKGAQDDGH